MASTDDWTGRCLSYVRTAFDVAGKYATATEGWQGAAYKHANDRNPPRAVPLWFHSSVTSAGHVAISLGDGQLWTDGWPTNTKKNGQTSIAGLEQSWKATYLGWSEDINGVRIYTPGLVVPPITPPPVTVPIDLLGEEMLLIRNNDNGSVLLLTGFGVRAVVTPADYAALQQVGIKAVGVSAAQFNALS